MEGDDDDDDDEEDSLEPPKSLSDCFEALAGAVFIDSGMSLQTVWESFSPLLDPLFGEYSTHYYYYKCLILCRKV